MTHRRIRFTTLAASLAAGLLLASCAGGVEPDADLDATTGAPLADAPADADAVWPRTVTVGGTDVSIAAEPQRIVALSTETGDLALQLVGHERVAAVAAGSVTEGAGNQLAEAELVETVLAPGTTPDPEQILALEPDLVLMTGRHDGEEDAAGLLAGSGVPALVFTAADFAGPDAVAASLRTIGTAVGADEAAETAASAFEAEVAEVTDAVAGATERPRVLALMARGDQVLITGIGSTPTTLAELAGGDPIAAEQGWNGTVPADAEMILATAPDVILVEDFRGAGLDPFTAILEADALADVPAIAEGQVHLVPSSEISGSAGIRMADGLRTLAGILQPDLTGS
ncbi:ABC transporter substrate-binding protein [Occultella gossypii]|uniref:ABC transporter substrate-binding protein n=1 Tax=Occultella gossypii TaxID=2800820 RepID=A0ABS7SH43_9MICO|nr:ABC transporter substrate-binding protein [Occultella gossypii]MBZ2199682.1 ABC transporter substrate-binding protein [Occultella gossypii]